MPWYRDLSDSVCGVPISSVAKSASRGVIVLEQQEWQQTDREEK
jgi:hypothetical protein